MISGKLTLIFCRNIIYAGKILSSITNEGRLSMREVNIKLSLTEDIKEFVKITIKYPFDIDLLSGRYVVDGKSILGIFSLDLTSPITVKIHSDDCEKFIDDLEPYIIKE